VVRLEQRIEFSRNSIRLRTSFESSACDGTCTAQDFCTNAFGAASLEGAAALGFIGAVGACGGYLIPRGFGASIAATGSPHLALAIFLAFYVTCIALTW
jgi:nitrate/nitrite transporter NarK